MTRPTTNSSAADLPEPYETDVSHSGNFIEVGSGPERAHACASDNPNWLRYKAANYLTLARWIEERDKAGSRNRRVDDALHRAALQRIHTDRVLEETAKERSVLGPLLRAAGLIRGGTR